MQSRKQGIPRKPQESSGSPQEAFGEPQATFRKPQETSYLGISVDIFLDQNLPEVGTSRVIQQTALIDVALSVNFLMLSFYERQ